MSKKKCGMPSRKWNWSSYAEGMLRNDLHKKKAAYSHALRLRREMTHAEKLLWEHVRAKRFHGFKFRRQVPLGPYIADFCCIGSRLIVEVDGRGHMFSGQRRHDYRRMRFLNHHHFRIIRFTNEQVINGMTDVLDELEACLLLPSFQNSYYAVSHPLTTTVPSLPQGEGVRSESYSPKT